MTRRLEDKVVIVTGAAGGIGSAIVRRVVREGARVMATDLHEAGVAALAAELNAEGADVIASAANIARREDVQRVVDATVARWGQLDGLVNNASASRQKLLVDCTDADFALTLDTNIWATFFFMQTCYPHLRKTRGSIVNFGSGAAIKGQSSNGPYAAAKEAVRGLSRTAVNEWGPDGIRINIVLPFANSPAMVEWGKQFPDLHQAAVNGVALRYIGDPLADIAPVVAFLLSADAQYVTGQTIAADGGQVVLT